MILETSVEQHLAQLIRTIQREGHREYADSFHFQTVLEVDGIRARYFDNRQPKDRYIEVEVTRDQELLCSTRTALNNVPQRYVLKLGTDTLDVRAWNQSDWIQSFYPAQARAA
jgi:hypothetical protein